MNQLPENPTDLNAVFHPVGVVYAQFWALVYDNKTLYPPWNEAPELKRRRASRLDDVDLYTNGGPGRASGFKSYKTLSVRDSHIIVYEMKQ